MSAWSSISSLTLALLLLSACQEAAVSVADEHIPGLIVMEGIEEPPSFVGGSDSLSAYLSEHVSFPMDAKVERQQNKVKVMFVVNEDGSITDASIQGKPDKALGDAAITLVSAMPAWTPAQKAGRAVATWHSIDIPYERSQAHIKKYSGRYYRQSEQSYLTQLPSWRGGKSNSTPKAPEPPKPPKVSEDGKYIIIDDERVYLSPDFPPSYPGGRSALKAFFETNLQYPEAAKQADIQGTVYVGVLIESDGFIADYGVLQGIGGGCDDEAIRLMEELPDWIPAMDGGKHVNVMLKLPVEFKLD